MSDHADRTQLKDRPMMDSAHTTSVTTTPDVRAPLRAGRRRLAGLLPALLILALAVSQTGCNMFILAGYLIGGPPSIEPEFDQQTKKSLSQKDIHVAVVCYAPKEVKLSFDAVDRELAKYVAHRLAKNHILVADPDAVQAWLDENADWDKPTQLGADLGVDYVIFIELSMYNLYEENSSNLFRGRCDAMIQVYEMEDDDGHVIFSKELISRYPTHTPVATNDMSYYNFKQLYMSRLSEEIGWLFYERYSGDDIPHGGL